MLEPDDGKPSSPVLRGLGASDGARLLDPYRITEGLPVIRELLQSLLTTRHNTEL